MIVTDPVPRPPVKSDISIYSQGATLAPPPYQVQPEAQPDHSTTTVVPRSQTHKRFLKALGVSVLVCFLFGMLTGSVDRLQRWIYNHGADWNDQWPIPDGTHTRDCAVPADWIDVPNSAYPYSSLATFNLPVSSDVLFLISRGSLAVGDVQILQTEEAGDSVKVNVTVDYHQPDALGRAHVCSLTRENGENGVGIFTPTWWLRTSLGDTLRFRVIVHLPAASGSPPLLIKKFTTDVPNFSHHLSRLGETVRFQTIALKGSNQAIRAGSLDAENAELKTSNGVIEGSFAASRALFLLTSNAYVRVSVDLHNTIAQRSTQLTVRTSNAFIQSVINLLSPNSTDGQYDIDAVTSNALVDIKFPVSPVNSALRLDAGTCNGPAIVSLNRAYEGKFWLKTSLFNPILEKHNVQDPSGDGRPRLVDVNRDGIGYLEGKVHYQPSGPAAGRVDVRTANAQVILKL